MLPGGFEHAGEAGTAADTDADADAERENRPPSTTAHGQRKPKQKRRSMQERIASLKKFNTADLLFPGHLDPDHDDEQKRAEEAKKEEATMPITEIGDVNTSGLEGGESDEDDLADVAEFSGHRLQTRAPPKPPRRPSQPAQPDATEADNAGEEVPVSVVIEEEDDEEKDVEEGLTVSFSLKLEDMTPDTFTEEKQASFLGGLAHSLEVPVEHVKISSIVAGSLVVGAEVGGLKDASAARAMELAVKEKSAGGALLDSSFGSVAADESSFTMRKPSPRRPTRPPTVTSTPTATPTATATPTPASPPARATPSPPAPASAAVPPPPRPLEETKESPAPAPAAASRIVPRTALSNDGRKPPSAQERRRKLEEAPSAPAPAPDTETKSWWEVMLCCT